MNRRNLFLLLLLFFSFQIVAQDEFITTWQTTSAGDTITIPTDNASFSYNYQVDWGDGTVESGFTGDAIHTYATAGIYTVKIAGVFPAIKFGNSDDPTQILSIEQWGEIEWESMFGAFINCTNLVCNATDAPDLSGVTSMRTTFRGATSFTGGVSNWDVSTITDMNRCFQSSGFDGDISSWNVSNVETMVGTFAESLFNQDISSWNVESVNEMRSIFQHNTAFNQDISSWNMGNVTNLREMFEGATAFNQNISSWDVSRTTNTREMFKDATAFNQDISSWAVDSVTTMQDMFYGASAFNQNLGDWNVSNVYTFNDMLSNSGLSVDKYDSTLIGWSALTLQSGVSLGASGLTYCNSIYERQSIIDTYGWNISEDSSCWESAFITTWETTSDGESITIPTNSSSTYDYMVNWGDGTVETGLTEDATHTYSTAGTFTIEILGDFPRIHFNNSGDIEKILTIEQWGNIEWESMSEAFYGCENIDINATDAPDLSQVTTIQEMFKECSSITSPDFSNWDVSTITNMNETFIRAFSFNGDISTWNVSNVTQMGGMFYSATSFNQDISSWNVSNVTSMFYTFNNANSFNQDISSWNVSKVTGFANTFNSCENFNQDLSNWNVSNASNMQSMFKACESFNQDLSSWDMSKVEQVQEMFRNAIAFNQDLSSWNMSKVHNFSYMFQNASAFDQDLGEWDMTKATNLTNMLNSSGMSTNNYDATLIGWSSQSLPSGLSLGASNLTYCLSETERQKIIDDFGWTINDASEDPSCVTTTTWDGSNWDNGSPTTGITALIEGDYDTYTDGVLETDDLVVKPTYSLTVRGNSSATVDGGLTNYGTILVQDTTSFIQTATSPSNSGSGTYAVTKSVEDYNDQYHYWSSPVQSITMGNAFPDNNSNNFYTFDASAQSWNSVDTSTSMEAGIGYVTAGQNNPSTTWDYSLSSISGFNSGTVIITPSFDGTAGDPDTNWNLLGNPYPSGLDVAQFLTDNSGVLESSVYLWSSDGDDTDGTDADYATINSLGTVNAGGSGLSPSSATISSCQGFFVQTLAAGDISFNNSQRVSTNNTFQRTTNTSQRIWLQASQKNGASNEILIGFMEDATAEKDQYDASKLSGNNFISFYSIGSFANSQANKLAIQGLPLITETTHIPLGIEAKETGEFTFSIKQLDNFDESIEIYLYDVLNGNSVDLRSIPYQVNLNKGEYNDRFSLVFSTTKVTSLPTEFATNLQLYASNQAIVLQFTNAEFASSEIAIYDISGKLIQQIVNQKTQHLSIPIASSGIYIIKVVNQYGVLSKKLFVD